MQSDSRSFRNRPRINFVRDTQQLRANCDYNYRFNLSVVPVLKVFGTVCSSGDESLSILASWPYLTGTHTVTETLEERCKELLGSHRVLLGQPKSSGRNSEDSFIDKTLIGFVYDPTMFVSPIDPYTCLRRAMASSTCSKNLVRFLQLSATNSELESLSSIVTKDLPAYIQDDNFCYVVKYLAKVSGQVTKAAVNYAIINLNELLGEIHTSRLLFSLCDHSELFRRKLLQASKMQLISMLSSLQGAILLSLLMGKTEKISEFDFILDAIHRDSSIVRLKCFGRAFSYYMLKCSKAVLDTIATVLKRHVIHLLNDSYGNYLLQIFYDRQCSFGMEMCQETLRSFPKKALMRKYCRYVLYKGIVHDTDGSLSLNLICAATNDSRYLNVVLSQRLPRTIFLLAMSRVKNRNLQVYYAQSILRLSRNRDMEIKAILTAIIASAQ